MSGGEAPLLRALAAHTGPVENVRVQSAPWRSATFGGARYSIWFDTPRGAQVDAFCQNLRDLEFTLSGGFVADIELIERTVSAGTERLGLALLTIDAG